MNVDLADLAVRDDLARALITQTHREIREDIDRTVGADSDCGQYGAERCGGCGECQHMMATYTDYRERWSWWQSRADELIRYVAGAGESRTEQKKP